MDQPPMSPIARLIVVLFGIPVAWGFAAIVGDRIPQIEDFKFHVFAGMFALRVFIARELMKEAAN
jgi:hypothetical protein